RQNEMSTVWARNMSLTCMVRQYRVALLARPRLHHVKTKRSHVAKGRSRSARGHTQKSRIVREFAPGAAGSISPQVSGRLCPKTCAACHVPDLDFESLTLDVKKLHAQQSGVRRKLQMRVGGFREGVLNLGKGFAGLYIPERDDMFSFLRPA